MLAPRTVCIGKTADGGKRFATFTAKHCQRYAEQGKAMLAKGLNLPVCWEHRSDAKPKHLSDDDRKSEKARFGIAGHVEEIELDSQNRVWANVEIPDEADAKQASKLRFCSPEIDNFTDGDGHDWGEVITHVALTPRPRQYDQPPIARLSLTGPIRLAFDPEKGNDMADDDKSKKDEGKKKKDDDAPELTEKPAADEKIKPLIEALREVGMTVPDEVVDIDGLVIAIKAGGAKPEEDEPLDDMGDDDDLHANVGPTTQSPPIGLSHDSTGIEKAAYDRLCPPERKNLIRRADRLVKQGLAPVVANKIKADIGKVQLSFGTDGSLIPNAVTIKLDALEEAARAGGWKAKGNRARLSHDDVRAVDAPVAGEKSAEETLSAWDKT